MFAKDFSFFSKDLPWSLRNSELANGLSGICGAAISSTAANSIRSSAISCRRIPRAEPPALAEYLIDKSILTEFQAERLLPGKTQGFVLGPVYPHGLPWRRQHGHGLQGPIQDGQPLVCRQGAAAAQHVERPHRPPQGALLRASPSPRRRAVRGCRHLRRHALPGLAFRRRGNARKNHVPEA